MPTAVAGRGDANGAFARTGPNVVVGRFIESVDAGDFDGDIDMAVTNIDH